MVSSLGHVLLTAYRSTDNRFYRSGYGLISAWLNHTAIFHRPHQLQPVAQHYDPHSFPHHIQQSIIPCPLGIWIPSQSGPNVGKIITSTGDVLTGFDITFKRNYSIAAESRPHQLVSLGSVQDGRVVDVPGDGRYRVESESQGDLMAYDPIEEAGLNTPAPAKSLRSISSVSDFILFIFIVG